MPHYQNEDAVIPLEGIVAAQIHLKLEGLNTSGSIKLKAALAMVDEAQRSGALKRGGTIIESSSGNLGCALAAVAAVRGLRFLCVVDPNALPQSIKWMRALGAEIICVTERDGNGGFLGTRIARVEEELRRNPTAIWLNQYANGANVEAHSHGTARALLRALPSIDYLFIGVGTSGTLMGCIRHFDRVSPRTLIVAVDSVGSVSFGTRAEARFVPGLGTSRTPDLLHLPSVKSVVHVHEIDGIAMCRRVARKDGILLGGSSGTILAGVHAWRGRIPESAVVAALSPDMGERYLDTVYDDGWVSDHFGAGRLQEAEDDLSDACAPFEGGHSKAYDVFRKEVA